MNANLTKSEAEAYVGSPSVLMHLERECKLIPIYSGVGKGGRSVLYNRDDIDTALKRVRANGRTVRLNCESNSQAGRP